MDASSGVLGGVASAAARPATLDLHVDSSFTRHRIERILNVVAGVGSSLLFAQAVVNALGAPHHACGWHIVVVIAVLVPLALMVLGLFLAKATRRLAGVFACVYPIALVVWAATTAGDAEATAADPWIWYLMNVATVAAIVAFSLPLQIVWAVGIPLLYGGARYTQISDQPLVPQVLTVMYGMILGTAFIVVAWMLRSVASRIDDTRGHAVRSYAAAAAADAAEAERIAVAALMHDSVLAALIATERARTQRERDLSVAMAREALTRLANVDRDSGEGSDAPVAADSVARDIGESVRELADGVTLDVRIAEKTPMLPGRVAGALVRATTQAVSNALEHAGGRSVRVELTTQASPTRVSIRVSDEGAGFNVADVADDRLGIRASIFARMAAVAGRAEINSDSTGTEVILTWQRSASA